MRFCFTQLFLFVIILSSSLYSQGYLVKKGDNAFIVSGRYSSNNYSSGTAGSIGYNIKGLVTLGFSGGSSSAKDEDFTLTSYGIVVSSFPLKNRRGLPITIGIGAGAYFDSYSGAIIDTLFYEASGNTLVGYLAGYYHIRVDKTWQFIPGLAFRYYIESFKAIDWGGINWKNEDRFSELSLFVDIAFSPLTSIILTFTPEVSFGLAEDRKTTTYSFGIGFNFCSINNTPDEN